MNLSGEAPAKIQTGAGVFSKKFESILDMQNVEIQQINSKLLYNNLHQAKLMTTPKCQHHPQAQLEYQQNQSIDISNESASTNRFEALPHKCHLCSMSFSKESGLKRHMKVHRPKQLPSTLVPPSTTEMTTSMAGNCVTGEYVQPFMCHICRMLLNSAIDLGDHMRLKHCWNSAPIEKCLECGCFRPVTLLCSSNPYRCEPCTFQYQLRTGHCSTTQPDPSTSLQVQLHQQHQLPQVHQQQHPLMHMTCSIVNTKPTSNEQNTIQRENNGRTSSTNGPAHSSRETFSTTPSSRQSSRTKSYSCPECPKSFAHSTTLTMHRKIHAGEFKYLCEYCDKPFVLQDYYVRHLRVHTKEKPFSCDVCDKSFSQSNTLTQHRRQHTGEKPFSCEQCGKQFSVRDYLNKHMRVHTGEKPYRCTCGKMYSQPSALRSHQKQHAHLPSVGFVYVHGMIAETQDERQLV